MNTAKQIKKYRSMADHMRSRASELDDKAFKLQEKRVENAMGEHQDKMLNRTQALKLLPFNSHQSLKNWENKVKDLGYLNFDGNKIKRSEVLRFRDDKNSDIIKRKLNR